MFENSDFHNEIESLSELLVRAIESFIKRDIRNRALWKNFLDHFNEVSQDEFELFITFQQRRDLFIFLKNRDVWIRRTSSRIYSQTLFDTLNENKSVAWTKDEYNKAMNYEENFDSSTINKLIEKNWERISSTKPASAASSRHDNMNLSKYLLSSSHVDSVEYSRLSQT